MNEIKWLQEGGSIPDYVKDVSEQMGEGCLLVGGPSWIRTPENLPPNLASRKMYIQRRGWLDMRCPVCHAGAPVYVFELEDDLMVSCCATCRQYGWFMKPKGVNDVDDAVYGPQVDPEQDGGPGKISTGE